MILHYLSIPVHVLCFRLLPAIKSQCMRNVCVTSSKQSSDSARIRFLTQLELVYLFIHRTGRIVKIMLMSHQ